MEANQLEASTPNISGGPLIQVDGKHIQTICPTWRSSLNRVLPSHLKELTKVKSSIKIKMINKNPPDSSKTCYFFSKYFPHARLPTTPFTTKHGASSNWRRVWQSGVVSSFTGSNVLEVLSWSDFNSTDLAPEVPWTLIRGFCLCWVNDVVEPNTNTYKAMGGFMVNG